MGKFNNVCVAASITGCSRALLLRAKEICKGVVYCDTDSLIARDVSRLPIGNKLGQWKKEHEFSELYIAGKKLYAGKDATTGKWKTASKGVRLSHEQIIEVAKGNDVEYEFDAPSYSIRRIKSFQDGGKEGATNWLRFTKRKVRRADKMKKRK